MEKGNLRFGVIVDLQGALELALGGEGSGTAGMTKAYFIPEFGITFCFSTNIGSRNDAHADVFPGLYAQVMDAVINGRSATMEKRERLLRLPGTRKTRVKK